MTKHVVIGEIPANGRFEAGGALKAFSEIKHKRDDGNDLCL